MPPEEEGWGKRKRGRGNIRPSNLLTDFGDDDEGDDERETHVRVVKQKNPKLLDLKVQAKQSAIGETAPAEVVVQQPVEIKAEEKEIENNNGVVWYEGMKEDLEELTRPDENLSKEGYQKRIQIVEKLKRKGINNLPKMSTENPGSRAYICREQLQNAVEYLNPLFPGKYRREAIGFLDNLGIGNNNGVPFLSGSTEAKEKEKEEVVPESNEDEKRNLIESRLIELSETKDEMLKKQLLEMLEVDGVRIKQLLEEVRITKPEWFDNLSWLGAVAKWWKMSPEEQIKYPNMPKLADYIAGKLGL